MFALFTLTGAVAEASEGAGGGMVEVKDLSEEGKEAELAAELAVEQEGQQEATTWRTWEDARLAGASRLFLDGLFAIRSGKACRAVDFREIGRAHV